MSEHLQFPGFTPPYYTQVPDEVFDVLLPDLTGAELKVLLYIIRRTFGFKKDHDDIGLDQLTHGITRHDGTPLDRGTGLTRETVITATRGLVAKGVILADRRTTPAGKDLPTTYRLRYREGSENPTHRGLVFRPGGAGLSGPQETVQETAGGQETSTSRPAPAGDSLEEQTIRAYVEDFGREFRDQAGPARSTGRAVKLWRRSGLSLPSFVNRMYVARESTKSHSGDKKMAYWFACLEEAVKS